MPSTRHSPQQGDIEIATEGEVKGHQHGPISTIDSNILTGLRNLLPRALVAMTV